MSYLCQTSENPEPHRENPQFIHDCVAGSGNACAARAEVMCNASCQECCRSMAMLPSCSSLVAYHPRYHPSYCRILTLKQHMCSWVHYSEDPGCTLLCRQITKYFYFLLHLFHPICLHLHHHTFLNLGQNA